VPAASGTSPARLAEVRAPQLQSPAGDAVLTNPDRVVLQWKQQDASGVPTLVEVSRDEGFRETIWHAIFSEQTRAEFVPDRKGRYFWRATRLGDKQVASRVASFEVERKLLAPTLARPRVEHGQTDRAHPVDAPLLGRPVIHYRKESWTRPAPRPKASWLARVAAQVVGAMDGLLFSEARAADEAESAYLVDLQWGSVAEATAYVLQISTDEDFKHVIAEKVLTQNSFSWHTDLAGFFYWRVAGIDKDGDRGPFSEFNTISIKAERNKQGDESSYETYLRFDEYSKYPQNLRISWGPITDRYYYSSVDPPYSVIYKARSYLNGQINYDYRLNSYYSLQFSFREDRTQIGASDFESRPLQPTYTQNETQLGVGVEKRIFYPRHYFALQTGVRATFLDLPIDDGYDDNLLQFSEFGFFGLYGSVAYHRLLGRYYEGALLLGAAYQHTGDSYRATQYASIEVRRQITDYIHVGLKLDEVLAAYRFNAELLTGQAHMLTFRPTLFVDWSF
jgi:hypothetical protein